MKRELNKTLKSGDEVSAYFTVQVPKDLLFFEGHFEGRPILPGIICVLETKRAARLAWGDLGSMVGVPKGKFKNALGPGANVELDLRRDGSFVDFVWRAADLICVEGRLEFGERD